MAAPDQSAPEWVPSPEQARLLEAVAERDLGDTIQGICAAAEVPRRTFYNWMKDPSFARAWAGVWRQRLDGHMTTIVNAQIEKAEDGDTKAATFLARLAGLLKDQLELSAPKGGVLVMVPEDDK